MAEKIIMPKLGLTMEEGVINKWLVKEGDQVEKGDALFEVATDKVNMEVESTANGVVLKIMAAEGETIPITQTVAYVGKPGEVIEEKEESVPAPQKTEEKPVSVQIEEKKATIDLETAGERIKASPLARRLASEYGLDLSKIQGTGPGGRIVKEDIEKAYQQKEIIAPQKEEKPKAEPVVMVKETLIPGEGLPKEVIPLTRMRKIIAERMHSSMQNKPHFYLQMEVLADELVKLRGRMLPLIEKTTGLRISYNDILIKIVAQSLEKFPTINAYFLDNGIQMNPAVNIGVAVALEDGLIVPVVKNANLKGLSQIVVETNDLSKRARESKLLPEEITGGTFTISNLGMYGVDSFNAIINAPESAILACGAIKKRPYFDGENIVVASLMNLTLSGDHQIVDGAVAAQFMQYLKNLIEEPLGLIV
ncbi:MAG: dihydrolipoamide acetyltransferase family protein [Atribacterota bacterium]|jgi:pyruvate dehydrogenase E2 component (dihydrolipoamide acetyltransferase)|uniref:Dihydrolipoamide acetyltransferase component of pyruvate dehydrogenase complex n=1 Tax=Candidatus Atribacter allofermentans TaxID=1852833 RepID=A0A1V5T1U8_9BACT|nr:dihydrolipoamide acetyltransferase family protein [Atribacterota bacterium]OQA60765.1 MAG: Dihydrolipoyllysine-residue acetyltransferase component of pyruvate dehydrogenase complex [Candidatus Atribacteria bacterium ADurb.Bin276]HHT11237.1 2-oxo acid dehydrogenase subunit E2 [Candidatus Atribacteria bacterium]